MKSNGTHFGVTQAWYARQNIESIESKLGHPIPGGLISMYDISDRLLDANEVFHIAQNISLVESQNHIKYNNNPTPNYAPSDVESSKGSSMIIALAVGCIATYAGYTFITGNELFLGLLVGGFGILCIIAFIVMILSHK